MKQFQFNTEQRHQMAFNQGRSASLILPGERHLRAGKTLGGQVWLQIDDQPRAPVPPDTAINYAVEILKLCGVHLAITEQTGGV